MRYLCRSLVGILVIFFAFSAQADPIILPTDWPVDSLRIGVPILLEAVFIVILLRRFRTPRFFILWILAMHLLTYPIFLGFRIWLGHLSSDLAGIVFGEVLIILLEGALIYFMCRLLPSRSSTLALSPVSVGRGMGVSLAGNLCSIVMSWILASICTIIFAMAGDILRKP